MIIDNLPKVILALFRILFYKNEFLFYKNTSFPDLNRLVGDKLCD